MDPLPDPVKVIQFTDTHFFKTEEGRLLGVDTTRSFLEVYKTARDLCGKPDLYLFTGDLSQDESEESYRRLSQLMSRAGAPCYMLPGNHDRRDESRRGLLSGPADFRFDRRIVVGNWLIVMLDTLVVDEVGGNLATLELELLEQALRMHCSHHALVCMHHQPVPVGAAWLDSIGLANSSDFWRIIDNFANVRSVLWGHIHQEFQGERNSVKLLATPSTCVQFKPQSQTFQVDAVPPGFRWLELCSDGTIKSAVGRTAAIATGLELSSAGY